MLPKVKGVLVTGGLAVLLYLSGLLLWLTPIPFLYASKKHGRRAAWGGFFFGLILLALLYFVLISAVSAHFGWEKAQQYLFWLPGVGLAAGNSLLPGAFGLPYFCFYGLMGLLLSIWEPRDKSPTVLVGRVVGILAVGVFLWVFWQSSGSLTSVISGTEAYFQALLRQMLEKPVEGTQEVQEQLAVLQNYGPTVIYYAVRLIPGMILAMAIFVTWLNIVVSRRFFWKDLFFEKLGPLKQWQLPFGFVWALITIALLLIGDIYFLKINYLKLFAINAFIIFGLIYFFQGLAILAFYNQRWSLPPMVRLVFYVLFFVFFQPLSVILLAVGFFDSWFDFRKLTPRPA
jgi:predicted membrane protein DUF2232